MTSCLHSSSQNKNMPLTDRFVISITKSTRSAARLIASNAEHHPIEHVSNHGRRSTEKDKIEHHSYPDAEVAWAGRIAGALSICHRSIVPLWWRVRPDSALRLLAHTEWRLTLIVSVQ